MDVVSGIVGFLSFSITICNGLVQYYQSWSSRDEAVNSLLQELTNLHLTLDLFREPFAELSAEEIGDEALDHIITLEHGLRTNVQKLEKILNRCKTNDAPANIQERIHIFKMKAIYPFKKETIQELKRVISDLQGTVLLSSSALQLYVCRNI